MKKTKSEKIHFVNGRGEKLAGVIEWPLEGRPQAWALFAHCFTCSKDLKGARNISRALSREGVATLRFDFAGRGESEGDFAEKTLSANVEDLVAAAEYLKEHHQPPQILVGHSWGGSAAILSGRKLDFVKAVATIGAPYDPGHVIRHFEDKREKIEKEGGAEVTIAGRTFHLKKEFLDDISSVNMEDNLHNLRKALLILHSPQDEVVGIDNAERIYRAALHPKSYISLSGADHLLANEKDSQYAGRVIASWSRRYIDWPEKEDLETDREVVVRIGKEKYYSEILTGHHHLLADEPEEMGGKDLGPSPYDYLTTALGTCTAMTLRMYADRKEWPLEEVRVHLQHDKIHGEDCQDCERKKGKIDEIVREIEVVGDLSGDQKERLLEIADKCPVHKTLHGEIKVRTRLRE